MKKLLVLACAAIFSMTASAQITWNVKGGVGVAMCYGSGIDDELDVKSHFVAKLGAGIEYPLSSNFSLMPSLEFAWKGTKLEYNDSYWSMSNTIDIYYLQVPVLAAYRFNLTDALNMTLKAGPYFAFAVSDRASWSGSSSDGMYNESDSGSAEAEKFDVGLDAGVDFEFHRFVLGVETEVGLTKIAKGQGDIKNLAFYLTVGYKF